MTKFVLVHGAWGGSWGFHKVRPMLWEAGHEVFTPSLTGIGERQHLATPRVDLSTHVQDVANTVHYEDLNDIVLLGFSYGGMVVTGALEHLGGRVKHLVYLDAFVPADGDSISTITGLGAPVTGDDDWTIPPIPRDLGDPVETSWVNERRSPQPKATFTEPVRLTKPIESWDFTRTYIKATADPAEAPDSAFHRASKAAKASSLWRHHEIACNHMVPIMKPRELTSILLDLAADS